MCIKIVTKKDKPAFQHYVELHHLSFHNIQEYEHRLEIFAETDDNIITHNSGDSLYTLGHNRFSHLSWSEFREMFRLNNEFPFPSRDGKKKHVVGTSDEAVDWKAAGRVTPVKDQVMSFYTHTAYTGMNIGLDIDLVYIVLKLIHFLNHNPHVSMCDRVIADHVGHSQVQALLNLHMQSGMIKKLVNGVVCLKR